MTDEEHYDDYIADQDPSFRSHTDITPDELTTAALPTCFHRSEYGLNHARQAVILSV